LLTSTLRFIQHQSRLTHLHTGRRTRTKLPDVVSKRKGRLVHDELRDNPKMRPLPAPLTNRHKVPKKRPLFLPTTTPTRLLYQLTFLSPLPLFSMATGLLFLVPLPAFPSPRAYIPQNMCLCLYVLSPIVFIIVECVVEMLLRCPIVCQPKTGSRSYSVYYCLLGRACVSNHSYLCIYICSPILCQPKTKSTQNDI
jgi:hypothetical protein